MGRPTKLTATRQESIRTILAAGNTRTCAVAYAGIDYQTFLNWISRGSIAKSGKFFEFFEAVQKAEADAEASSVAIVRKAAAAGNWQAAAWWLERRKAGDYRRVDRVEATGDGGGPQETVVRIIYEDDVCQPSTTSGSNGHTQLNGTSLQARLNGR